MPSKCCKTTQSIHLVLIFGSWLVGCFSSVSFSQDFPQPAKENQSQRQGIDRTSLRPSLPDKLSKPVKIAGITSVELEPGLGRMLKGDEPRNQVELISLEKKKTKVAEKVNLVTVNLHHGNTQGSGVIITARKGQPWHAPHPHGSIGGPRSPGQTG